MSKKCIFCLLTLLCSIALAAQTLNYPTTVINGEKVYIYQVEKSIGLYRIGINFGVTQEDILRLNPQVRERGLRYDEFIYVPVKDQTATTTDITAATEIVPSPEKAVAHVNKDSLLAQMEENDSIRVVRIGVLLPFQVRNKVRDSNMDRFVDFYEGVLLGIHDLQNDSILYELRVLDTDKNESNIEVWLEDSTLSELNAIVGLAYPKQINTISPWAKENHVPVLAPFVSRIDDLQDNPYLIQFNASIEQEAQALIEWMEARRGLVNCVIVEAPESEIPANIQALHREIRRHNISHTSTSIKKILAGELGEAFVDGLQNIVIFNTDKYSQFQVLVPRVEEASNDQDVVLYTKYSWQVSNTRLPQIYTSIFSVNDMESKARYEQQYKRYFAHEHASLHPRFDLLGYDMIHLLIEFLNGQTAYRGLQSDIVLEKVSDQGGYQNKNITIELK